MAPTVLRREVDSWRTSPPPAEGFEALVECVGYQEAATMRAAGLVTDPERELRELIEAIPEAIAAADIRRILIGWIDGRVLRPPAGRPAALAREVLAAAGLDVMVLEGADEQAPAPKPPEDAEPELPRAEPRKLRDGTWGAKVDQELEPGTVVQMVSCKTGSPLWRRRLVGCLASAPWGHLWCVEAVR